MMMRLLNVIIIALLLNSCTVAKQGPIIVGSAINGVEERDVEFVVLNSGEVVKGDVKVKGFSGGKIEVDGKIIPTKEIMAYQKENRYLRRVSDGDFVPRVIKGRINCYYAMISNTYQGTSPLGYAQTKTSTNYYSYIQKGNNQVPVTLDANVFKNMISDYKPALDKFLEYENLSSKEKRKKGYLIYQEVVKIYNNQ